MTQVVPGFGNPKALIAVVGEAPGQDEDREGYPFIGKAGQYLRARMSEVGIDPNLCWFSNLMHCRPPGNSFEEGLRLGGGVCRVHWLFQELQTVKPWAVLASGAWAGRALMNMPEAKASTLAAQTTFDLLNRWMVVGSFHPSYALRSGESGGKGWVSDSIRLSLEAVQIELARRAARGGSWEV